MRSLQRATALKCEPPCTAARADARTSRRSVARPCTDGRQQDPMDAQRHSPPRATSRLRRQLRYATSSARIGERGVRFGVGAGAKNERAGRRTSKCLRSGARPQSGSVRFRVERPNPHRLPQPVLEALDGHHRVLCVERLQTLRSAARSTFLMISGSAREAKRRYRSSSYRSATADD